MCVRLPTPLYTSPCGSGTKIFHLIHRDTENFLWIRYRVRSGKVIYEEVQYKPFERLLTDFLKFGKRLLEEMVIICARRSTVFI